jgi:hypothetical protein
VAALAILAHATRATRLDDDEKGTSIVRTPGGAAEVQSAKLVAKSKAVDIVAFYDL